MATWEKVISGMRNHLAEGQMKWGDSCPPLPGEFCLKTKIKIKQTKEYKIFLSGSFLAQQQLIGSHNV